MSRINRPIENLIRRSGGSVSGWRILNQTRAMRVNTRNRTNIERQSEYAMINCPIDGAMTGTRMNIVITKDITLAIMRPS